MPEHHAMAALGLDYRAEGVIGVVTAVVLLGLVLLALLVARRLVLGSARGTFECYLRVFPDGGDRPGPWRAGLARYEGARVAFFATLAFGWWPTMVLDRNRLEILDRPQDEDADPAPSLASGTCTIMRCRHEGNVVELAMDDQAAAGFAVWVESGPPGRGLSVA